MPNDMSQGDPNPGPQFVSRPQASRMRESDDVTKLYDALAAVQDEILNPPRNRSVDVRTQSGSYKFRYATFDKIVEMARPILASHGLFVQQPIVVNEKGQHVLLTRLCHRSGQFQESEMVLPQAGKPQEFGSVITYYKRYAYTALLCIPSDEDDDANSASGNHMRDSTARKGTGVKTGNRAVDALLREARLVNSQDEGHGLLDAFARQRHLVEEYRAGPLWNGIVGELGAGLTASLGKIPAAAFVGALRASKPDQIAYVREHWNGEWRDVLAAMEAEAPDTFNLLADHVRWAEQRIAPKQAAPEFHADLYDQDGKAVEHHTDPVAFATAYSNMLLGAFPPDLDKIQRANAAGISAAWAASQEAADVLGQAGEKQPGDAPPQDKAPAAAPQTAKPPEVEPTEEVRSMIATIEKAATQAVLDSYLRSVSKRINALPPAQRDLVQRAVARKRAEFAKKEAA